MCVAQLDRALGYGPRCREFESSHARTENLCFTRVTKIDILKGVSFLYIKSNSSLYKFTKLVYINHVPYNALVAQLDRASGYGPEGREFESCPAHEKNSFIILRKLFFFHISFGR